MVYALSLETSTQAILLSIFNNTRHKIDIVLLPTGPIAREITFPIKPWQKTDKIIPAHEFASDIGVRIHNEFKIFPIINERDTCTVYIEQIASNINLYINSQHTGTFFNIKEAL